MKTIMVTLDPASIENAIKEINEYRKEVERKTKMLVQRLTDLGASIARIKIADMGAVYSGELLRKVGIFFEILPWSKAFFLV